MCTIPEKLKRARRPFDDLPQITLLEDWCYDKITDQWYIKIRIEIDLSNEHIPKQSDWYVVVTSAYPFGRLKIYPSIENSITVTFPHQSNNATIASTGLWRNGALCTEIIDRPYGAEPFGIDSRIIFHLKRAINWLEDAVNNKLILDDDLFELPDFIVQKELTVSVIFSEDYFSYTQWEDINAKCGTVKLYKIPNPNKTIYRTGEFTYSIEQDKYNLYHEWGSDFTNTSENHHTAIWIKLRSTPVVNVWQAPFTLLDLKQACQAQGIELLDLLKECVPNIRDKKRHILLIGFPIPKHYKKGNEIIFWQALLLPCLSAGKLVPNGFRLNEKGWWVRDITEVLKDNMQLEWLASENWNEREISLRGQLPKSIRRCNVVIIGCGSLGATMAELLIRSGVHKIQLIDNDIIKIGNLSRHTLAIQDIGCIKSKAVAERLNLISPHARVEYSSESFHLLDDGIPNIDISKADIIFECTGENSVLNTLTALTYKKRCHIISISIGLEAKRIYIDMQNALTFQYNTFQKVILEYLKKDEITAKGMELPRDGTGCWHPTFPARIDDMYATATLALKVIETYILSKEEKGTTLVFEQDNQYNFFTGYKIIEKVVHE